MISRNFLINSCGWISYLNRCKLSLNRWCISLLLFPSLLLIRWLHCLGASLFMVFILIHWIRGAWIRLKVIDSLLNCFIWVSGWVILSCSLIEGFFGYILNWGQMSYWGITVMINLLSILPLVGLIIAELIWCSCNVIINRIFVVHFSLGFLIGLFIFVHLFVLHSFSSIIS